MVWMANYVRLPDKHIQDGYGDQVAFIYDSPVTQTIRKYTFFRSKNRSSKTRWRMQSLGLKRRYNNNYAYDSTGSLCSLHAELA
jgi:hypothetical protein